MIFYNGIEIKEDIENIKKAVKSGLIKKIGKHSKYEEKYETEQKSLSFFREFE